MAYFAFTKPPIDLSHLPPVESLNKFIAECESTTRKKGLSVVLFEDPDATGMADRELLRALNEKL